MIASGSSSGSPPPMSFGCWPSKIPNWWTLRTCASGGSELVPTGRLHGERKSIGLQPLIRAYGEGISYEELPAQIEALRPSASQ